ncbi:hypothetical protein TEQG_03105 [Trichophyton equinum CBS 127.97]|uniref:Uncharacterized protein n=1 Tax=Trichophyton equinum (strain ATCC MYA-4606 / CBS 127.97) TaxID=559882 RepID=F2PQA5_TRIEC|nr:hypothetical protein TEQG_03105 [Trichophyton equinum CBS 127.97]
MSSTEYGVDSRLSRSSPRKSRAGSAPVIIRLPATGSSFNKVEVLNSLVGSAGYLLRFPHWRTHGIQRQSYSIRKQDLLYEAVVCFLKITWNAQMALVLLSDTAHRTLNDISARFVTFCMTSSIPMVPQKREDGGPGRSLQKEFPRPTSSLDLWEAFRRKYIDVSNDVLKGTGDMDLLQLPVHFINGVEAALQVSLPDFPQV